MLLNLQKQILVILLKIQSQIQGDQIRVTAKKIDDLQEVINKLKSEKLNLALQYINFKK